MPPSRFAAADLVALAASRLDEAGMENDKSQLVASILVEGDLLGHDSHGLVQLPNYLKALREGKMVGRGQPEVLNERGAVALWDGHWICGVWLLAGAIETAIGKAEAFGIGSVSIRRAHHTACLQAYLQRATDRGFMVLIATSDPSATSLAAHGGREAVMGTDPIAVGIPTTGDPILVDMSSSITANGMIKRYADAGEKLPGPWVQDAQGTVSDDPGVFRQSPPGSLLPTGGVDHGHKGFGMALTVEALTHGLSGHGRRMHEKSLTQSIYVQVMDPSFFSGLDAYVAETTHLAQTCRNSAPRLADSPVRLPGERALAHKRRALADGLSLRPEALVALGLAAD